MAFRIAGLARFGDYYDISPAYFIMPSTVSPLLHVLTFILCLRVLDYLILKKSAITLSLYSLGKYSFGIYLIHYAFIVLSAEVLEYAGILNHNWSYYPIVFITTTALSYISARIISYLPYSQIIIGTLATRKS
ncbi:acyltransferase family protein [Chloroflexota bacterium]